MPAGYLLINAIGYSCSPDQEALVLPSESRAGPGFLAAFAPMMTDAEKFIHNRSKREGLGFDFITALEQEIQQGSYLVPADFGPSVFVEWGRTSYRIFRNGLRLRQEEMNADSASHDANLERVKNHVMALCGERQQVLIATTGFLSEEEKTAWKRTRSPRSHLRQAAKAPKRPTQKTCIELFL